ncbi:hypothetical protein MRBLMX9_001637 [Pseudomonas brassicacearum]|uniref:hypothetical protein n=1 Tax=Pseudomonas brassicacearum TaxID=930166 RepID=UPI003432F73E
MRRPKTKRNIEAPSNHLPHRSNDPKTVDVWLSRLSHLSQFGLFALTIGALYFTVIPLYKTAALEESIARRESELRVMNEKLEAASVALDKVKLETYRRDRRDLQKRIVFAAPFCSGLMTPPHERSSMKNYQLGDNLLKVDAAHCLREEFKKSKAEETLKPEDYSYLRETVENISTRLSQLQKQALLDFDSVPERAAKDPSILAPMGPAAQDAEQLTQLIETLAPGIADPKRKFKNAVDRTRSKISLDFSDAVRKEILELWNIEWPEKT